MRTWIFQGNPDRYDIDGYLAARPAELLWLITRYDSDISVGDRVYLLIGSANHDPEEFSDSECLNIQRQRPHSVAFGNGAHFCIGSGLARVEAYLVFASLLRRLPGIRLASQEISFQPVFYLRSLERLMVNDMHHRAGEE